MSYRDGRQRSPPHKSRVLPPIGGVLQDIDDQVDGYKNDRVQNQLLKEICSDIGKTQSSKACCDF